MTALDTSPGVGAHKGHVGQKMEVNSLVAVHNAVVTDAGRN